MLSIPRNVMTATTKKVGNANQAWTFFEFSISIPASSIVLKIKSAKAIVRANTIIPSNE